MKLSQPTRLLVAAFVALACSAAQSPCSGENTARQFSFPGTGLTSAIPFTGVVASVVGDATLATAEWKQGLGCPTNLPAPYTCFASADPADQLNVGLLLAKTGPTTNDLAILNAYPNVVDDLAPYAAAELQGVAGAKVSDLTELGYDLRKPDFNSYGNPAGSHCGLRSPRFNVVTKAADGTLSTHSFFCLDGLMPLDGANQGWIRLRWTPDWALPLMDPADTIQSIKIVFDEGSDPTAGGPDLFGAAIIDNIDVNGVLIGSGPAAPTPTPPPDDEDDGQGEDHEHNCFHFHDSWSHGEHGRLSYSDRSAKLKFVATGGARSIQSSGPKCVRFVADGLVNGKPGYTANFEACDRSAQNAIGTFSIAITGPGGFNYTKTSTLSRGKVKLHF